MNEGPKQNPGDYVNWDTIRKTPAYKTFMLTFLRGELEEAMFPGLQAKRMKAFGKRDDSGTEEEFLGAMMKRDPATKSESEAVGKIYDLKTIEAVIAYWKENVKDKKVEDAITHGEMKFMSAEQEDLRKMIARIKNSPEDEKPN
jgi:hypothetical protein